MWLNEKEMRFFFGGGEGVDEFKHREYTAGVRMESLSSSLSASRLCARCLPPAKPSRTDLRYHTGQVKPGARPAVSRAVDEMRCSAYDIVEFSRANYPDLRNKVGACQAPRSHETTNCITWQSRRLHTVCASLISTNLLWSSFPTHFV